MDCNCTRKISENPIFAFNNLRVSCPESHVPQSRRQEPAKRVPPRRAGSAIGRVSSCTDSAMNGGTAHCRQQLNCPHLCESQQMFPRNDIGNLELRAPDQKSYISNDDTRLHQIYRENVTPGATLMPNSAHSLLTNQAHPIENAQNCPSKCDINGGLKSTDSVNVTTRQDTKKKSSNYINTALVQKVLDSQKNLRRIRSPMIRLGEASRIGQNSCKHETPIHHLSDTSLNKAADFTAKDLDTVSTESQKESGYHSGGSAGDRSSATSDTVDLNRFAPEVPVLVRLSSAPPGTSVEQCDYYFVQADEAMEKYKEQERLGNLNQALDFLNQAIEFFQMASNVAGSSSENVLRMRMKHNKAVLCRRKLVRNISLSTKKASRRLPCLPRPKTQTSTVVSSCLPRPKTQTSTVDSCLQACKQFCHSEVNNVLSPPSRVEQVSYLQNKIPEEHKIVSFSDGGNCCQKDFPEKTNDDIVNDFHLHNTLPKKNRNGHLKHECAFSSPNQWSENLLLSSNHNVASHHNENDVTSRESNQKKSHIAFYPTTGHSTRRVAECHRKNRSQLSKTPTEGIRDSTAQLQNSALHFREVLPSNAATSYDVILRDQRQFIRSWSEAN